MSRHDDSTITATVNLGRFDKGQSAYLFVVDATGKPSATGLQVTIDGGAATTNEPTATPNAPTSVAVH